MPAYYFYPPHHRKAGTTNLSTTEGRLGRHRPRLSLLGQKFAAPELLLIGLLMEVRLFCYAALGYPARSQEETPGGARRRGPTRTRTIRCTDRLRPRGRRLRTLLAATGALERAQNGAGKRLPLSLFHVPIKRRPADTEGFCGYRKPPGIYQRPYSEGSAPAWP
jgi:hypothetical protein